MKKLYLLPLFIMLFSSCETKKSGIIAGQKLINQRLLVLQDSLQRVSDTQSINRIRMEIKDEQLQFDSLTNELEALNK